MALPDPERWSALTPYLDEALELSDDQRPAWFETLRRERPAIADEVAALLERHRVVVAERFLERGPVLPDAALSGQRVGAYTLKSPIGHGGMGSVWLAERSDGRFERHAAVKFLNVALAGRGEARFRREGSILGRLTHPHIAQLLDAGVAPSGQPYLVLEHIDGEPIDRYCEARALDAHARVVLFLDVLDAVAHAHANLIVHRDIKPSNVLVRGDGTVKLLDFGIAKLLEDEAAPAQATKLTLEAGGAFTLEYAAPEQVAGEPVSTATDVYALGVLLFVLLTGRHPSEASLHSPAELIKAIVDKEAPRPSETVADSRARRLLRGDVDTIVATALKKKPADRYASVTAMADDLRRHLSHEPIGARPDTWSYRTAKFVRRHRWPVAAAGVMLAVLTTGLLVVDSQRRLAESRFNQLRQLSEQVFALDVEIRELPGATDARAALVAASLQYLEGLAADTGGDLDLMAEVGYGYLRTARIQGVPTGLTLGDFRKAEESLAKADGLIGAVLDARPRDLRALDLAAQIAHDRMIVADSERRRDHVLDHAQRAAERIEAVLSHHEITPPLRERNIGLISNVALAHVNLRRYDDAVRYARRQLELAKTSTFAQQTFAPLSVLANALRLQGDLEGALSAVREARALADRAPYANDTERMINRYGLLLREGFILGEDRGVSLGRAEEAIVPLREAFELQEAGARRDPNDYVSRTRVATSSRELGDILRWRNPQEAVTVYDTGLRRLGEVKTNPGARRDTALLLANSSYALRRLDRVSEARRRIDQALAILVETKDYPSDRIPLDREAYAVLMALADHHAEIGQPAQAIQRYKELLDKALATKPEVEADLRDANSLSLIYEGLSRAHRLAGDIESAAAIEARRTALWQHWNQKLPNNSFVAARLTRIAEPGSP